jgi:enolase
MGTEVFHHLKAVLKSKGYSTNVETKADLHPTFDRTKKPSRRYSRQCIRPDSRRVLICLLPWTQR